MSMGAWLMENARIYEQLEDTQELCRCSVFKEHCVTHWYIATYWIKNKLCPVVWFYSAMEAQLNMRCCIIDGLDRGIVTTNQCVLNQVNSFFKMFLPPGKFIRNQVLIVWLATHETPGSRFLNTQSPKISRWSPFYLTIIWELNEKLCCTGKVGDYSKLMIGSWCTIH